MNRQQNDLTRWHKKVSITWKYQYVRVALVTSLEKMSKQSYYFYMKEGCCQAAVNHLLKIQIFYGSHPDSVMRWHK